MSAAGRIVVRVTPRAGRDEIRGVKDGVLLVRLKAPPVEGAANEGLVRFLADCLSVPKSSVAVESGQRSRTKQVSVEGMGPGEILRRLGLASQ